MKFNLAKPYKFRYAKKFALSDLFMKKSEWKILFLFL